MAWQSGVSTPIFDELLREMAGAKRPSAPAAPAAEQPVAETRTPQPRRRHRAE